MAPAQAKPILVYDGECPFCRRWVARWRYVTVDVVDYEPYQTAAARFPEVPREAFGKAVHLFEPDGSHASGAGAVFRAFALAGRRRALLWCYERVPGFATVCEAAYGTIAGRRDTADQLDRLLIGDDVRPATYRLSRSIFLRLMGVVYFVAFASLRVQVDGLVGGHGILPAADLLRRAGAVLGAQRFVVLPTLLWFNPSDAFLHFLCDGGMAAAVLLVVGVAPMLVLIWLWVAYLSLTTVGQDFLSFQWDGLLLEAGLLSVFYAPVLHLWSRRPPSRVVLFLLKWLLFRLMFMSAVVKWMSGDVAWHTLAAMRYHYETQPLPPWTAWYFHHMPGWFGRASVAMVFFIEGVVPFGFFGPRRVRLWACRFTVLLQALILATGNFGFFNILAVVLCVPLLDDAMLKRGEVAVPRRLSPRVAWVRAMLLAPVAGAILWLTVERVLGAAGFGGVVEAPNWLRGYADPFRSANPYGLFAIMTTTRPEIVVEGSGDGVNWKAYGFRYKVGDVGRRPGFCVPHMPRLDWQMWFAALGDVRSNAWFVEFLERLLEGRAEVIGLLGTDPFPDHPPRYVRAVLYEYRFTTAAERAASGDWWVRKELGVYCPAVSLGADGRVRLSGE